ncbi:fatty-acyl-CoA synthase [Saccharomonospora amisosensis]|uniref:Fatty-acyl-CoA synthase n=1 Tax=Saccharomonospora amisosensis TaxID=1128677 RepID=A0A7X5UR44_9PSEU|nr:AMP-binding protein [Saccharomonospora amisosensis]NIJ12662.1 fatty-acyl-CoA synthase [Saccharomonospora amisosensis]
MNTLSDRMPPNLAGLDGGVGQVLRWPPVNLLSLLSDLTKRDPHAIIAIDVDPDRPAHVSRAELWRRTLQLRADLATAGVARGDAVAVCLPNWSTWLDWHVAAASLGAHVVGLRPHCGAEEVTPVLQRARPRVVALPHALPGSQLPDLLREATAGGQLAPPAVAVVAGPHGEPPVDPSGYDVGGGAWLPSATTAGMPMPVTSGDELAVAFAPSLAAHLESSLVRFAVDTALAIGLRHDDVLVCAEPLSSPLGLGSALAAVAGGATCLLEPTLKPGNLLAALSRFAATHLAAAGEVISKLARQWHDTAGPKVPNSWRWLGVALAERDMAELAHRAEKELGVTVSGLYGSAEVLSPAALWPPDSAAPRRWSAGGLPVSKDIEVRVVDPDSGRPLPPGETGELQFRGYCLVDHYLGEPAAPARVTEDGWLSTGDRGALLGNGEFRHEGRIAAVARD